MKKLIIENPTNPDHVDSDVCVVHCVDNRLLNTHELLRKHFGIYDALILVGGSKSLTDPSELGHDFNLWQVETCLKLHNIKKVALTVHQKCGAYKGSIPDGENEDNFLERHLDLAENNVRNHLVEKGFEGIEIKKYIVDFDGVHEIVSAEAVLN